MFMHRNNGMFVFKIISQIIRRSDLRNTETVLMVRLVLE